MGLFMSRAFELVNNSFARLLNNSEYQRVKTLGEFHAFYDQDYESIMDIVKTELKNKVITSQKTLDRYPFLHNDIIQKSLARLSAGIYDENPTITINGEADDNLEYALVYLNFFTVAKEILRKALFVNTIECAPIYRADTNRIDLDVIMPDEYTVTTYSNHLEKKEICVARINRETNQPYYAVWSGTEHYLLDLDGNQEFLEGNLNGVNPYKVNPYVKFSVSNGLDYYGEPNWNLYNNQKAFDVMLTNLYNDSLYNHFPIKIGINLNLKDGDVIAPNSYININDLKEGDVLPDLKAIQPQTNFGDLTSAIDWFVKRTYTNLSIPSASASTEIVSQSGVAKQIDEVELKEIRDDLKNKSYYFCINLLNVIRTVWNYNASKLNVKQIPDGEFDIDFIEETPSESEQDKWLRIDNQLRKGIYSPVEIIMQEREISEDDAKKVWEDNKQYLELFKNNNSGQGGNSDTAGVK